MQAENQSGFSLIELLIALAIIGILALLTVPTLLTAYERSRQRSTMGDMHQIALASGTYHVDFGEYPSALSDLEPNSMSPVPPSDTWGNAWVYGRVGTGYTLTSLGLDGASGPAPPSPWYDEPFEPDLIVTAGAFTQFPERQ